VTENASILVNLVLKNRKRSEYRYIKYQSKPLLILNYFPLNLLTGQNPNTLIENSISKCTAVKKIVDKAKEMMIINTLFLFVSENTFFFFVN